MPSLGMLTLGIFIGSIITIGIRHTTDFSDLQKLFTTLISAAFAGAVFSFIDYAGGNKLGEALFFYPVGLVLGWVWVYTDHVVRNLQDKEASVRALGWLQLVGLVVITLLALAVLLWPAFRASLPTHSTKAETRIKANVSTMKGEEINDAVLTCGSFGYAATIQSVQYSRRLEDLTTGTVPDGTISFANVARMDFLEMTEEEWKTFGSSQFRAILKANVTFRDGNTWSPVYIVSHCYLETPYGSANFSKLGPRYIVFRH